MRQQNDFYNQGLIRQKALFCSAFFLLLSMGRKHFVRCISTIFMEEKPDLAVSSYPELYDSTSHNYHDLNNKQQTWTEISAALEISGMLGFFFQHCCLVTINITGHLMLHIICTHCVFFYKNTEGQHPLLYLKSIWKTPRS